MDSTILFIRLGGVALTGRGMGDNWQLSAPRGRQGLASGACTLDGLMVGLIQSIPLHATIFSFPPATWQEVFLYGAPCGASYTIDVGHVCRAGARARRAMGQQARQRAGPVPVAGMWHHGASALVWAHGPHAGPA